MKTRIQTNCTSPLFQNLTNSDHELCRLDVRQDATLNLFPDPPEQPDDPKDFLSFKFENFVTDEKLLSRIEELRNKEINSLYKTVDELKSKIYAATAKNNQLRDEIISRLTKVFIIISSTILLIHVEQFVNKTDKPSSQKRKKTVTITPQEQKQLLQNEIELLQLELDNKILEAEE